MARHRPHGALRLLFILTGVVFALSSYALGQTVNFTVFSEAAHNLWAGVAMYPGSAPHFKYGPTFALLFTPFAALPAPLGVALWGCTNFVVAFEGLRALLADDERLPFVALVAWAAVLITTDGDQSNLLVVGLVLLAVAGYRRGDVIAPAVFLSIAAHVKLFPAIFCVFAVFVPGSSRRLLAAGAFVVALFALGLAPLFVTGPRGLLEALAGWQWMTRSDYAAVASGAWPSWSAANMLRLGLGLTPDARLLQAALGIVALAPLPVALMRPERIDSRFLRVAVAELLLYAVLFNHRSESCSFVIAAVAVALWGADKRSQPWFLVGVAIAFGALAPLPARWPPVLGWPPPLDWLVEKRTFYPARLVPLTALWTLMLLEQARALRGPSAATLHPSRS